MLRVWGLPGFGWASSLPGSLFPIAVSTPIFGRLSDRRGRKSFISVGLLLYAIISLGFIWAASVSQLVLIRLLHGAAGGMVIPIARAYVGDISPEGEEGKWMGYANAAFFTGFGVGPLIGGVLTEHFGMNIAFLTMSGLNLLAFFIAVFFLPEVGRMKLTSIPRLSFKKIIASSTVKGLFAFRLVFTLGRGAFAAFLPIFAAIYLGLSPTLIGILLAVHLLLMSLLGIPAGRIADRLSRKMLVVIGSLIGFTFMVLIPQTHNFWQLMAVCVFGGFSGAISIPAALALNVEEGRKFGMGSTIAGVLLRSSYDTGWRRFTYLVYQEAF